MRSQTALPLRTIAILLCPKMRHIANRFHDPHHGEHHERGDREEGNGKLRQERGKSCSPAAPRVYQCGFTI